MKEILKRLQSPVVIIQLVSIIAGAVIFFNPSIEMQVKYVSGVIVVIVNILSGLNNPKDKEKF